MADNYPVPEQPVYNPNIRQLQDSDPARASTIFNPLFTQLIENIHAVKKSADAAQAAAEEAGESAGGAIPATEKGAPGGLAELDESGHVPASQLPSYVDDVVDFPNRASFPETGEGGKIYVAEDTNITYRWSGSSYVPIGSDLALGETSSTAYRGDRGKIAYDHSQVKTGNPHNTKAADIGYTDTHGLGAGNLQSAVDAAANAAQTAQTAADSALEAITKMAHTIDAIPSQNGSLTYTGSEQTPSWNSYNPETLDISGVTMATDAGEYEAIFTPKDGYTWSGDDTSPKTVTWRIGRASIAVTPSQSGSLTYTGQAQSPTWNGYDSSKLTIGGEQSATNAGNHTATFTPTANYQWSDGSVTAREATWTIGRAVISVVPSQLGTLTYTGSAQNPQWSNYDSAKMTLGGTTSGTNAGNYTATFTPTANYKWSDGGTGAKNVSWSIGKAAGSLSVSLQSLQLTDSKRTGSITVTRAGDGAITAESNATGVATVSVSGNIVTVTGQAAGSAVITIKVAAGTNHTAPANKTVSVAVEFPQVFGVRWNKSSSSTALARLTKSNDPNSHVTVDISTEPSPAVGTGAGSSPFDNYAPWKDMEEYNIINNAVSYKRGASGFSRTSYDTMVYIPEFWFKIVESGNYRYFYIANKEKSGFTKHPGSGKYVARYNTISGNFSKSGAAPLVSQTRAQFRSGAKGKGTKWSLHDFASWNAVWLLYLVEFADWNSQAQIGRGYVDSNSSAINSGATDSMSYHTGRPSGTDGKTAVQYRHIENPWGNVWEWIDGANFNNQAAYICTNPANYADDTTSNYTAAGVTLCSSGWIKDLGLSNTFPWAFLPDANGGSETTYIADYVYSSSGWRVLMVGGDWDGGSSAGLFYFNANYSSSNYGSGIGARLLFHP